MPWFSDSLVSRFRPASHCFPFWTILIRALCRFANVLLLAAVLFLGTHTSAAAGMAPATIAGPGKASLASAPAAVALRATLPPSLTLTVSAANLNVAVLDPKQGSAAMIVPVTSSWTLNTSASAVELIAYFESPNRAFEDENNERIPSSRVLGSLNDEVMMPFTQAAQIGISGAARVLFDQPISRTNIVGTRDDSLRIKVGNIADLGLHPGTYRGTLHLRLTAY
jgi:hypothetical protein